MTAEQPLEERFRQGSLYPVEVSAEIEIEAPRERVWAKLADLSSYPEWNVLTPEVAGELRVGSLVRMEVRMPGALRLWSWERVNLLEEGRRFAWGLRFGHPSLLVANRLQELSDLPGGGTRYFTVDRMSGILTPLVMRLYREPMRRGFVAAARALKEACERESQG